jgi:SAM-dependent methyltransferase
LDESLNAVIERMREDWNRRAIEDARYYVAYGRRNLGDEEFAGTAVDTGVLARVARDFAWLPQEARARRVLEIGCGLGRLMRPLSRECGEIHGIDISDEMVARARQWLAGIPHAHVHVAANDLCAFASASFHYVYSFAVFQHIPDRRCVFRYFDEALRVLQPGGIFTAHLNSLPVMPVPPNTWCGVAIPAADIAACARDAGWQLLSMEGAGTQYLWVTMRKPEREPSAPALTIARMTRSNGEETYVRAGGPIGFASVFVTGLPVEACDINQLAVRLGEEPAPVTFISPDQPGGLRQLNVQVPATTLPGRKLVEVLWRGRPVSTRAPLDIIAREPLQPRIVAITDGAEVLLDRIIRCGWMQISTLECEGIERFRVTVDGHEVTESNHVCIDPLPPRHMVNCRIPGTVAPGRRTLQAWLGDYAFPPETIEIT